MLLGSQHQKSDVGCSWQNGRIEQFFGTFKEKFKQVVWSKLCPNSLQKELDTFHIWYNHVRVHLN